MSDWKDGLVYLGGSESAEARKIKELSDLVGRQVKEIEASIGQKRRRPQHAKTLATTTNAKFVVSNELSEDLNVGFLVPCATYPATLRFSNAGALITSDRENDLRWFAAKVHIGSETAHDFLCTNAELHHAKNAYEAVWTSYCLYRPGVLAKIFGIIGLMTKVGIKSGLRILETLSTQI